MPNADATRRIERGVFDEIVSKELSLRVKSNNSESAKASNREIESLKQLLERIKRQSDSLMAEFQGHHQHRVIQPPTVFPSGKSGGSTWPPMN